MADGSSFIQKWRDYRASKATLFWAVTAAIVLTVVVGFTWGGWVTGSTATTMERNAASQARAQLAAAVCVERFLSASDARAQLASLKGTSLWQREDFIEKGGWATLPGFDEPIAESADLCADRLASAEVPQSNNNAQANKPATKAQ